MIPTSRDAQIGLMCTILLTLMVVDDSVIAAIVQHPVHHVDPVHNVNITAVWPDCS
jgi:hypothetical protein